MDNLYDLIKKEYDPFIGSDVPYYSVTTILHAMQTIYI